MNKSTIIKLIAALVVFSFGVYWGINTWKDKAGSKQQVKLERKPVPVNACRIERGAVALRRTFSGTLEARREFEIASKVSGRVERLTVDLSDLIPKNKVIAYLDDDEFKQAVTQAEAELAIANANAAEAKIAMSIAVRAMDRIQTLKNESITSDSQYDVAVSNKLAKEAALKVADAQVVRAKASLETAKIHLSYTEVKANWNEEDSEYFVARRFVDEGTMVSPNIPIVTIISLNPINCIVYVTEKDYGKLQKGQIVTLITDAFANRKFTGEIERISPIFNQASRQARIEIKIDNCDFALKPGIFVRAEIVLDRVEDAILVPVSALVKRGGTTGVFVVNSDGRTVSRCDVTPGIREGDKVQVTGNNLNGLVVTLGQQLLVDGSAVSLHTKKGPL